MLQDLRFALRLFSRHRSYAAIAVVTMALGVGANTAVFSIADSVLFRRLPFDAADRLFALRSADPITGEVYGTLPASAVDAARATGAFDAVASASPRTWRAYVRTAAGLQALAFSPASHEYLDLLGVHPAVGRSFDASDAGTYAVVLTHETWMKQYGGNPGVIGSVVPAIVRRPDRATVSQPLTRIVGVLPARVRLPLVTRADGLVLDEDTTTGAERMFAPLVRLAPGVTASAAAARLQTVRLTGEDTRLRLVPLREELAARQDPVLWLLFGAAGIVLLTACVNLANLTIARGSGRVRELAIRASLGSSRAKLIRLLLAEAMCIAACGTGIGLIVGYWGTRTLGAALPPLLATAADPAFDVRAFVFTLGAAASATVLFSVIPAVRLTRIGGRDELRSSTHVAAVTRRGAQLLVAAEVGICVALMIGAALVGRTLFALVSQDLGFAPHRLVVNFDLPTMVVVRDGVLRTDTDARAAFYRARLRDVRDVPGIHAAGLASSTPFSRMAPDARLLPGQGDQAGAVYDISSGYFSAMGIPLLAGRDLTDEESFGGGPVGVLNLTAARLLCGTPAACLGRVVPAPEQPARTVIGVVSDARPSLERAQLPTMYVPFPSRFTFTTLVISADDAPATADRLKQALSVSPDARVDMRVLDDAVDRELSPYRFNAIVIGGFATLTLLLAIVGVYGVMAAIVTQRTREYGIRLALGATPAHLNRHVLGIASVPVGWGVAAGVMLAAWMSRFIGSLLYGVVPLDGASFGAAAGLLVACGLAAAFVPARRASRVDPVVALRAE